MAAFPVLPNYIRVHVTPAPTDGLVVDLFFKMCRKNDYSYLVFLDAAGVAVVSRDELLKAFHETKSFFLMDYADPETCFTGQITAKVLSVSDIERAIKAFEMFHEYFPYPEGYEERLRAALARGQDPGSYDVDVLLPVQKLGPENRE